MRNYLLCLLVLFVGVPGRAGEPEAPVGSCHITYSWPLPDSPDVTFNSNRHHRLSEDQIAKLPKYSEVKIELHSAPGIAMPDFTGEIKDETSSEEITYHGAFQHAVCSETFVLKGDPIVLLPPVLPAHWDGSVPSQKPVPSGLKWRWDDMPKADTEPAGKFFGVVVQLFERFTTWKKAQFTGTCTTRTKGPFGTVVSRELKDAAVTFHEGSRAKTQESIASVAFRL